jgi:hypothetical protein
MDEKRYSLNDIFAILHETTALLFGDRMVTVISEDETETQIRTPMSLSEYMAMTVAHELISDSSRLACEDFTASKTDVEAALTANYFEPVAFPNYEHYGIAFGSSGGRRKTRKNRR